MAKIQLLAEHIANQIAAGEVVEGPSSVVKELVENSIDAGASKIVVELSNQYRSMKISDNGSGMSAEDLQLAFKRHATSKIQTIEDLERIQTNGFRGEALASIASVSKLTAITKRIEDEHASKLYLENSEGEVVQAGASTGTSMLIDDLFYNTPARLKFLKTSTRERNEIIDLMRAFAIANPGVSFTLVIDGKQVLKTSVKNTQTDTNELLMKTVPELFGQVKAKDFNTIEMRRGDLEIFGLCSSLYLNRTDKRGIVTVLNGRVVKCYILRSAIDAVYKTMLPKGKHPYVVLMLNMPAANVDVNVHPTKKEVKYKNSNAVYTVVGDAVAKALADAHYADDESFQPSLQDHSLRQDYVQNEFRYTAPLEEDKVQSSVEKMEYSVRPRQISFSMQTSVDKPRDNLDQVQAESISRKFISRFGSVDISFVASSELETVISAQGNKTSFEIVASDQDKNQSVLLRGDFIGTNRIKEKYLAFLKEMADEILQEEMEKIANLKLAKDHLRENKRSRPSKKPSMQVLQEIWERDNYSCVYCGKLLLHPDTVKSALEQVEQAADIELLNSHVASYDHHLPASKAPELNEDARNLHACCIECNIKKSNSLASKTWQPTISNSWEGRDVEIAGIKFESAKV